LRSKPQRASPLSGIAQLVVSLGGLTAGFQSRLGRKVEIVCQHQTKLDRIRSHGSRDSGLVGNFSAKFNIMKDISDPRDKTDLSVISPKRDDAMNAAGKVVPFVVD